MAKKYNYYGVRDDYAWHLLAGTPVDELRWYQPGLFQESAVVWYQGPRGGVRIVHIHHTDWSGKYRYGYIRQDSEAMKEFAWVKLRAVDLG